MRRIWHKTKVVTLHDRALEQGMLEQQRLPRLLAVALGGVASGVFFALLPESSADYALTAQLAWAAGSLAFIGLLISLRLSIEVRNGRLDVYFRPFYRRFIPLNDIIACHEFTAVPQGNSALHYTTRMAPYSPYLRQVAPTHGVQLTLRDGKNWLVSTAHPQRLLQAIEHARKATVAS